MKEDSLKDKCLSGYAYYIKSEKIKLMTGHGGAKMCIDECRKSGVPDELIGDMIQVETDFGTYSLNDLKVIDK